MKEAAGGLLGLAKSAYIGVTGLMALCTLAAAALFVVTLVKERRSRSKAGIATDGNTDSRVEHKNTFGRRLTSVLYRRLFPVLAITVSFALTMAAHVFVAAKAGPKYTEQIHVVYGVFFYAILLFAVAAAYVLHKQKISFLPLLLVFVLLFLHITDPRSRLDTQDGYGGGDWQWRKAVMTRLADETVAADKTGKKSITLNVPKTDNAKNWPIHEEAFGKHFSRTLHTHGLISRRMDIKVKPDGK